MTFEELRQSDITDVFLPGNGDGFDEVITYTPNKGTARDIAAIVDEDRFSADTDSMREASTQLAVFVQRSDTLGIDDPQAGDTISFTRSGRRIVARFAGPCDDGDNDATGWWVRFTKITNERMGGNVRTQ